jgi:hypothetical protein
MLFIHIFGYVICTIQNSEDFDILDLLNSVVNIDEIAMSFDNDDVPDDLIDFADNLNNENFNLSDMGLYLNEEPTILAEDDCSSVGNMFKKYDCSFDYESVTEDNYVSSLNCSENQKIFTSLSANGFCINGSQQMDFTVNSLEDVSQYEYSDVPLENVPIINRILGSHQSGSSNDSTKYSQENAASIFEVDNTSQNGISNFETKGSQQMDFTVNSLEDVSQYEYSDVPLENVPIINRILGSHQSGSSNDSTKYSQENAASIFEVDNTSQNGISNFEENASLNKINQERSIVNQVNETKIDSTDKIYTKGTKNTSLAKKSTDFDTLKDGIKTKEKYNDLFKLLQKVEMKYPGKIREKYGPVFYSKYEKILEILRKKKKELSSKNKAKQAPRSNDKIIINNPVYNITTPQMLLVLPFPIFPSNNMTLTLIPLALTTTLTDIKAISYLPITGPPTSDYKNMQEDTNVVYQNSTKKSSPDSEKKDNVFLEKKLNSQKPCHSKSKDMTHNINYSDKNNSCVQEFVNFEKFTSNLNNIFNDECTKKAYDSIFSNSKDLVSSSKTKARTLVNNQYLYLFNILSIIQNDGYLNIDYFESSLDNFDDKFNKIKLIESFLTSTFEAKFTFLDKPDIQYKETTAYKELLSYYDDLRLPNISDYALRHTYKLIYKNTNSLINSGYIDRDCDLSILNCFVYDKMCLLNDSLEKILVCQSFLFVTGVLNANAKVKQMLVLLNLINYLQFGHTKWDSKWDLANFLGCLLRSTNPNLKYKNIISFTKCFNKLYESRLLLQSLHYNEKASRNVAILMGMFVPFIVSDQNSFDIIFTGSIDKQLDRNDIFNTIYQGNIGLMMKFFKKIKFIN